MNRDAKNPGSALGESIGTCLEKQVHLLISTLVEPLGYQHRIKLADGKELKLEDYLKNKYKIDGAIIDENGNLISLTETKFLRYAGKHGNDKASWICTAHGNLRGTYPTLRNSIAVLVGDWTTPRQDLLERCGICPIHIPLHDIEALMLSKGVPFKYPEDADKDQIRDAWHKWLDLGTTVRDEMMRRLLESKKPELEEALSHILRVPSHADHQIKHIFTRVETHIGNVSLQRHTSVEAANIFLNSGKLFDDVNTKEFPSPFLVVVDPAEVLESPVSDE